MTNSIARRTILLGAVATVFFGLLIPGRADRPESHPSLTAASSPAVIDVLAGEGVAWRILSSPLLGFGDIGAGMLVGLLEGAAGKPGEPAIGDPIPFGFASYGRLSVEMVSGSSSEKLFIYAPIGATDYFPFKHEIALPAQSHDGLRISRAVRVSEDGSTCTWFDAFSNETGAPLIVWAVLTSDLDAAAPARFVQTSSGDVLPDRGDAWLVSVPAGGGRTMAHVLAQPDAAAVLVDIRSLPAGSGDTGTAAMGSLAITYQVALEAGATGTIRHTLIRCDSTGEAARAAEAWARTIETEATSVPECDPRIAAPDLSAGLQGQFTFTAWTYADSGVDPTGLDIYGSYAGVDASARYTVWRQVLLDSRDFAPGEKARTPYDRWIYERSLGLNTAAFAGGYKTDRILQAVTKRNCAADPKSATGIDSRRVFDASPCHTHIDILSPAEGVELSGIVSIAIQPYCEDRAEVELYAGGSPFFARSAPKEPDHLAPARIFVDFDSAAFKAGPLKLTGMISDASGCRESETITVVIANGTPSISIDYPDNNGIVAGTVSVRIQASDDRSLDHCEIFLDGSPVGSRSLTGKSSSFSMSWDTIPHLNGFHVLSAVVTDGDGATARTGINVDIRNVAVQLTARRLEAQQKSYAELRFEYQNSVGYSAASFTVWRKAAGEAFALIAAIPLSALKGNAGAWLDILPSRDATITYRVDALDTIGLTVGRSNEITI